MEVLYMFVNKSAERLAVLDEKAREAPKELGLEDVSPVLAAILINRGRVAAEINTSKK